GRDRPRRERPRRERHAPARRRGDHRRDRGGGRRDHLRPLDESHREPRQQPRPGLRDVLRVSVRPEDARLRPRRCGQPAVPRLAAPRTPPALLRLPALHGAPRPLLPTPAPSPPAAPLGPTPPPGSRDDLASGWVQEFALAVNEGRVAPPGPAVLAHLRKLYEGDVRSWDQAFGELVKQLEADGILDHTIVVVT